MDGWMDGGIEGGRKEKRGKEREHLIKQYCDDDIHTGQYQTLHTVTLRWYNGTRPPQYCALHSTAPYSREQYWQAPTVRFPQY
eukprot:2349369-Rhodomonas_salina.1